MRNDYDYDYDDKNNNNNSNNNNNKQNNQCSDNCKGCICNQLRRLQTQTEVDVFLLGGQVLEDVVFINLDQSNCCAFFNDPTTEPGSTLIIDCQKIQAIRIEAD